MPRSSSLPPEPDPAADLRDAEAGGSPGPDQVPGRPARLWVGSVGVGLAGLALMLATEPRLAIVWDEGYSLGREARIRTWLHALRDPVAFAAEWKPPRPDDELVQQTGAPPPRPEQVDSRWELLFDPRVLAYFWPFAREEPHGHPAFYAILGLLGDVLAPTWQELPRARLGPILLFCATGSIVFHALGRRWGAWPALAAAGAWFLQPNLFAHGHYAAYDAVLSSLWILALLAFARSAAESTPGEGQRSANLALVAFGVVLGCALANKLTGWFIPFPLAAWVAFTRSRRGLRTLLIGVPIALVVVYLLQPAWWVEPIAGPMRFFNSNLTREETIQIPIMFLGRTYLTPSNSLPPYNTIVWTLMVTPVVFLSLALVGVYRAVSRGRADAFTWLILANWIFLLCLRAMSHTPGHDGVRLFLPAFGMVALMAGAGASQLQEWVGARSRLVVVAALVEGIVSIALFMPVPLSYFSPIVGGLPGAARLGMEPTYYWDALDAESLAWLREHTGPGETIRFSTFPSSWLYLRRIGALPRSVTPVDPGAPAWYVTQNRPGMNTGVTRLLAEQGTPAHEFRKFGVPLIRIYPASEVERLEKLLPR
ncbi:glycosyltransferase family 39 protein [Aquisphaera insulae]|uniref:glycosyltransferase family 39 protein n=1 Tax=Aquisphaera insulae TaxID=2712864 RepID=UPI0013E9FDD9|nr:glycosyltransferase family 39 protein [Aquisphaera insulae]